MDVSVALFSKVMLCGLPCPTPNGPWGMPHFYLDLFPCIKKRRGCIVVLLKNAKLFFFSPRNDAEQKNALTVCCLQGRDVLGQRPHEACSSVREYEVGQGRPGRKTRRASCCRTLLSGRNHPLPLHREPLRGGCKHRRRCS